jgi:hypothetical protein
MVEDLRSNRSGTKTESPKNFEMSLLKRIGRPRSLATTSKEADSAALNGKDAHCRGSRKKRHELGYEFSEKRAGNAPPRPRTPTWDRGPPLTNGARTDCRVARSLPRYSADVPFIASLILCVGGHRRMPSEVATSARVWCWTARREPDIASGAFVGNPLDNAKAGDAQDAVI